ncbi:MAG: sugar porter family MFS transporter [Verrucomicrobia bacterium]|nr:MAG: sugar porter family MFS transporter [Verrucomicrobiota bacterium]
MTRPQASSVTAYNRFLLLVAGLGGLLYGIDVGIIAGALPYLQATSGLSAGDLSFIVAAVLAGSVISTLFSGLLSDWLGRKPMMIISGILFVASIPMIALSHGFGPLVLGRLLQGISAGFVGVAVPLYLAECLGAANRGKGTGIFQWLLTLGIVAAALIAMGFSVWLGKVELAGDATKLFAAKNLAWRSIFWVSLPPGVLFVIGASMVSESPRWLFRKGRKEAAKLALLRSRTPAEAELEMQEMATAAAHEAAQTTNGTRTKESLLRRKYLIPFLMACVILACNQATGVNSIIGYNATILIQAGLSDVAAHWGYVILTSVNFLVTMVGVMLVDKKGRKFLLSLGSAGIIASLVCAALMFSKTEKQRVDCAAAVQAMVTADQSLKMNFDQAMVASLLAGKAGAGEVSTMIIIYSYGDFRSATKVLRSDDKLTEIAIERGKSVPDNKVKAFFDNPLGKLDAALVAPLTIENALVTPVPSASSGWLTALCIFCFMAFFAVGPGVCVWLALSELMPTRIRSNGMAIALVINQVVSTVIAAVFLPTVGKYGYGTMFFGFAACTVVYFITAAFFLPETKGKTLEEIAEHFEGKHKRG